MIEKIVLKNFKQFRDVEIDCKKGKNIFVGENGAGKTTLLQALGLVLSGSHAQIEKMGIASLFNIYTVSEFLNAKALDNYPTLDVELYFDSGALKLPGSFNLEGKHNTKKEEKIGIRLKISPNEDATKEIELAIEQSEWTVFPFEFYKVEFMTFSGKIYTSYTKPFKFSHTFIDTSLVNSNQEIQKRIEEVYMDKIAVEKRPQVNHRFRKNTLTFMETLKRDSLIEESESDFTLSFDNTEKSFRHAISISKNKIDVKNLGYGEKVLLSVENAHKNVKGNVKIILVEEPENHLSYLNMQKLINIFTVDSEKQVFIATHSNMIASRLGVNNLIFIHKGCAVTFNDISPETVDFFKKSINQNLLNFIQSDRVILVEGNAEYILMEYFYELVCSSKPENDGISIISVNGLSFKRYLEIAEKLPDKKIAVITDNDGDYSQNIEVKYKRYIGNSMIQIFSDTDNQNDTFEVCLYNKNSEFLAGLNLTTSSNILEFMLREKAEFSLRLLEKLSKWNDENEFVIPEYIREAIEWLRN